MMPNLPIAGKNTSTEKLCADDGEFFLHAISIKKRL
jgi:hypothetical protein